MKGPLIIIGLVSIVIIALLLVEITFSNQIATTGTQLMDIQAKTDTLKNQNLIIQQKVLAASSLNTISQKAAKMGFIADTSPVYITNPLPLALNQ